MARQKKKFEDSGLEVEVIDDFCEADALELLENNEGNRPQKSGAIERYAEAMLMRRWDLNGEPIIIGSNGQTLSGQNRAKALIKAEKKRKANPTYYAERFGLRGPVKIPVVIIRGVQPKFFRSLDAGEKRSGGDMFFVAKVFDKFKMEDKKPEFSVGQRKRLSRILSTAARTVWLRLGGKDVSDAPKLPPAALEEFVKKHPLLIDCVAQVFREDDGAGNEKKIASLVSPAYVAAVYYLAGVSNTDREDYDERGQEAIDAKLMDQAEMFLSEFASGANLEKGSPVLSLRQAFQSQRNEKTTRDRDVVLNMLVKAMTFYMDGAKGVTVKDLKWDKAKDEPVPRLGGLDVEVEEPLDEDEEGEEEAVVAAEPKPRAKSSKKKAKPVEETTV